VKAWRDAPPKPKNNTQPAEHVQKSIANINARKFDEAVAEFAALITLTGEARGILNTLEENLESMAAPPPGNHDMYMQMEENACSFIKNFAQKAKDVSNILNQ
jgi:hypothetical protein